MKQIQKPIVVEKFFGSDRTVARPISLGFLLLLCVSLLLPLTLPILLCTSCARHSLYSATFFDVFDTCTTLQVATTQQHTAEQTVAEIHDLLRSLDGQFDIYHAWDGGNNLWDVNRQAGQQQPLEVSEDILELLTLGQTAYEASLGMVNICMGSVLSLWHTAREDGTTLPSPEALAIASGHTDITALCINREEKTVYLSDAQASLDVGAIAKGYAASKVSALARTWLEQGSISGLLLDLGGHILALGQPPQASQWHIGIRDIRGSEEEMAKPLTTLSTTDVSVVTSGIDQRYYEVEGVRYHHLIHPDTSYPAMAYQSVTVCLPVDMPWTGASSCFDSTAMADAWSTALFLLPLEEGKALLQRLPGASAYWINAEGEVITYVSDTDTDNAA